MHPAKALGPYGLPAGFYQHFLTQVKNNVTFCLNVLNSGAFVQDVNKTNIVLIPKVEKPMMTMKQYIPISLCNVIYKIVSKTIAIRFRTVLPDVVFEEQSAFIKERLISDNVMVAYEVLHQIRGKRTCLRWKCALKLDMSKAYDGVDWRFAKIMMCEMGFPAQMIKSVIDYMTTVRYTVIINGTRHGNIIPQRGLHQGNPLSLYLFLLCSLSTLLH